MNYTMENWEALTEKDDELRKDYYTKVFEEDYIPETDNRNKRKNNHTKYYRDCGIYKCTMYKYNEPIN